MSISCGRKEGVCIGRPEVRGDNVSQYLSNG